MPASDARARMHGHERWHEPGRHGREQRQQQDPPPVDGGREPERQMPLQRWRAFLEVALGGIGQFTGASLGAWAFTFAEPSGAAVNCRSGLQQLLHQRWVQASPEDARLHRADHSKVARRPIPSRVDDAARHHQRQQVPKAPRDGLRLREVEERHFGRREQVANKGHLLPRPAQGLRPRPAPRPARTGRLRVPVPAGWRPAGPGPQPSTPSGGPSHCLQLRCRCAEGKAGPGAWCHLTLQSKDRHAGLTVEDPQRLRRHRARRSHGHVAFRRRDAALDGGLVHARVRVAQQGRLVPGAACGLDSTCLPRAAGSQASGT